VPDVVVVVHVEVVDPSRAAGVTLYDQEWPTPVVRTVTVSRTYGEVLEKDLRDVPVVELVEDGAAALTRADLAGPAPGRLLDRDGRQIRWLNAPPALAAAVRDLRRARAVLQRSRVDLGLVAHTYREAQAAGRKDTTVAVAVKIDRSRSTAAYYVSQARRAGLLPPVPRRNSPSESR